MRRGLRAMTEDEALAFVGKRVRIASADHPHSGKCGVVVRAAEIDLKNRQDRHAVSVELEGESGRVAGVVDSDALEVQQAIDHPEEERQMSNRLVDLNDHLFTEIERLSDTKLVDDAAALGREVERASAMCDVAGRIIGNADTMLKAAQLQEVLRVSSGMRLPDPLSLPLPGETGE